MPASVFLTTMFKAHNPSRRKQAALYTAIEQYTNAYQDLLDCCRESLDTLEEKGKSNGRYREALTRWQLPKPSTFKAFQLHSSMHDAMLIDEAGSTTSYLSLKAESTETGFPACRDPKPDGYPKALDEFPSVVDDLKEETRKRAHLHPSTTVLIFLENRETGPSEWTHFIG